MDKTPFHLRLLFVVLFVSPFTSACSERAGAPAEFTLPAVDKAEVLPPPSAVPDQQGEQDGSVEPLPPQSTVINVASVNHFDCAVQADENATIAMTTDTSINGDLVLEVGDEIAVFNPDGSICAGMDVWTGQNIVITVWSDDSQTDEIDGLVMGDAMHYRIWDASQQVEYQVADVEYRMGDGLFVENGIYILATIRIEGP